MRPKIHIKTPKHLQNSSETAGNRFILNKTGDGLQIMMHGIIGNSDTGMDATTLSRAIVASNDLPLTVRIDSPGGSAYDGITLFNVIASHGGPTETIIEGMAGSAASLIAIAADKVRMHSNAVFHIHEGLGGVFGHIHELERDFQDTIEFLKLFNASAVEMYASKTGKSPEVIRNAMFGQGDGTRYSAQQAYEFGFVDEIIHARTTPKAASGRSLKSRVLTAMLKGRITDLKMSR